MPVTAPSDTQTRTPITQYGRAALIERMQADGESAFRAKQVLQWVYEKRVTSFDDMSNLSLPLRERLASQYVMRSMELAQCQGSADTTRKYLFRLTDGRYIECVLIPASVGFDGERSGRHTLCVSSQVGCAYDCKFCASGLAGFTRNLTVSEIVEQVLQVEGHSGQTVNNIVFMGMGEPLANLSNLMPAIEIINAHWGIEIGARHMTISTSGLAPQIKKLADQPLQIRLAISLHGASNSVRDRIMPVNKKYPLERLFEALEYYRDRKKQRITFEYILIDAVNADLEQAALLGRLAKRVGAKVNLIPYNTVDGLPWVRPPEDQQWAFTNALKDAGVMATLRTEKGHDIDAACGQLRLKQEEQDLR